MKKENSYVRIGTQFFRLSKIPLISGDVLEKLIPWNIQTIRDDHGYKNQKFIDAIPRYIGFVSIPTHINYQRDIRGFYNTYEPINYTPKKGNIDISKKFVKHIFEEHYDLGLDYLKILYEYPTQILPILSLVSYERGTGKTTFLNWLKAIYASNMTINKKEDFRSNFNSDWASKLIIAVEEVLFDRLSDTEYIKNLSTSKFFKAEAKSKDKVEIEFFSAFILASNHEKTFVKISPNETRFWVRKIKPFENEDEAFLDKLISEIPAFLYFLINREYHTENSTRMWFKPK